MCSTCCYYFLKVIVVIVNLLVMLVGMVVTGVAVWVLVSEHTYLNTGWEELSVLTFAVLAIGLLMSLLAFLACCGAITSSKCLLGMFVISLLAVLVGQVSLAVLLYFKVSLLVLHLHSCCLHQAISLADFATVS